MDTNVELSLAVECWGSMRVPEVAIGVLVRAAIFAVAMGFVPKVLAAARQKPSSYLWFLLIGIVTVLAFVFRWDIEYGVTRMAYLALHRRASSVVFLAWPSPWIAPAVGIACGIVAGLLSTGRIRKKAPSE